MLTATLRPGADETVRAKVRGSDDHQYQDHTYALFRGACMIATFSIMTAITAGLSKDLYGKPCAGV